jgi:hypothetical protein
LRVGVTGREHVLPGGPLCWQGSAGNRLGMVARLARRCHGHLLLFRDWRK